MNRGREGVSALLLLPICGALTLLAPPALAKTIAPFRAALDVRWGSGAGSDAFRADLSRSLSQSLASGCFASIVITGGDGADVTELRVDVVLSEALDETVFDDSIADTLKPDDPGQELRHVARFEVTVDATLTASASGALVARKHFVERVSRRPVYLGEDAQATARAEAIEEIGRDVARGFGCGGAKLERKIRDALGTTAPAAPASR